ncbi:hypothetical protein MML48_3g00008022 [Holotrichia oblita]|uniref:Uncharacterized protein n=1 Tax=Holotrichia oblita TaxID=644536 RepID=A0ACB9TFY9_HOLOL|nr:hypothetical protein MML48_3g00008022 [Holotrichia oblita]
MDSNFQTVVGILKQNVPIEHDHNINIVQLELNQRKFEMELVTKRKQVSQLREEVDTQNQVNHVLRKNVTNASARIESLESELKLLRKNTDDENDLKARLVMNNKFQREVLEKENASFKELLQKSEMDKRKLERQIEDLNCQQRIYSRNMNDLLEQDQNIRNTIEKYAKLFDQIDKEKERMSELYHKLGEYQKYSHQIELMNERCKVYISKNKQLEEEYAFAAAKLTMLEELHEKYSLPQFDEPTELQKYYMEKAEDSERNLKTERELMFKLQERLNKEIESNVFLCNTVADLEKKVVDLERKRENYGNRTVKSVVEKLQDKIPHLEEDGFKISISEEPFCCVILTPLMLRAHSLQFSSEIIFVDSSGSCDQGGSSVYMITDFEFRVSSSADEKLLYTVDASIEQCDCPDGAGGTFCKHLCAVYNSGVNLLNSPDLQFQDRLELATLALGYTIDKDFFLEMDKNAVTSNNSAEDFEKPMSVQLEEHQTDNQEQTQATAGEVLARGSSIDKMAEYEHFQRELGRLQHNLNNLYNFAQSHPSNYMLKHIINMNNKIESIDNEESFYNICSSVANIRMSRRIKVQPISIARRDYRNLHGGVRAIQARPSKIEGIKKKPPRKKRSLTTSIYTNTTNAYSH